MHGGGDRYVNGQIKAQQDGETLTQYYEHGNRLTTDAVSRHQFFSFGHC